MAAHLARDYKGLQSVHSSQSNTHMEHMHSCMHVHVPLLTLLPIPLYKHMHVYTQMHVHTHAYTPTHTHTHTHTCRHTYNHARMQTHACTHTHAHACTHTHTHAHTHTHTHTYAHTHARCHFHAQEPRWREMVLKVKRTTREGERKTAKLTEVQNCHSSLWQALCSIWHCLREHEKKRSINYGVYTDKRKKSQNPHAEYIKQAHECLEAVSHKHWQIARHMHACIVAHDYAYTPPPHTHTPTHTHASLLP